MSTDQNQYHVLAVKRSIQLLNLYASHGPGIGISDIAKLMGIHKSVVHKLLVTMASEGWVYQNPSDSKYYLGLQLLKLSQAVPERFAFRKIARQIMDNLVAEADETATLTVLDSNFGYGMCIELVECSHSVRLVSQIGREVPLHAGASGLIMAAHMPSDKIEQLLLSELKCYTPHTITNPLLLRMELDKIKTQGYALTEGQVDYGLVAIAAPILNARGELIAGLNISGPNYRFESIEKKRHLISLVQKYAQLISEAIIYSGDY